MAERQTTRRRVLKHFVIGATSAGALTGRAAAHDDEDDATTDGGDDDTTSESGANGSGSSGATGRVVLTFDHLSPSVLDTAAPILQEYDYPSLLAVVTNRIGGDELDQLRQLQSIGWEIGSHSMGGHPRFTGLSHDRLVRQVRGSKAWLTENGFARDGGSIVYPYGAVDSQVADVVRRYFSVGFYGGSPTEDPLLVDRVNGDDVPRTKRAIADAANGGGTAAIMYHTVGANDGRVTTAEFRETMEYIAGRDVQVVSASTLAGRTSNDGGSQ